MTAFRRLALALLAGVLALIGAVAPALTAGSQPAAAPPVPNGPQCDACPENS